MDRLARSALRAVTAGALLMMGVAAADAAGALAVGRCGAYGFSYDYTVVDDARRAAQQKCTGDCKVVSIQRACAAFAVDGRNVCGPHGYAVAAGLGEAQNTALKHCYQYGGRDCMIRAFTCDGKKD
jgi:hypothetical protein